MLGISVVPAWVKPLAIALTAAAVFGSGWAVNGWRLGTKNAQEAAGRAETARKVLAQRTDERDALADRLRASDDLSYLLLQGAQDETTDIGGSVLAGERRLLIAAKCPTPGVPEAASAPGVDPDPRAELDPEAGRAYLDLRTGINRTEAKLVACQGQLKLRSGLAAQP